MATVKTGLSSSARKALEDAVGRRHVSDDPAFMASYSWVTSTGGLPSMKQLYDIRPIAVVMPESSEEVQAIVLACCKHDLKFRAHSTGTASFSTLTQNNTVSLELCRMNKILDIARKNQLAIIEFYVTAQQLQAEALKVGLTTHVIGAGWTHSPLASASSLGGIGITGNHTSSNGREGPGPGFRGMLRGYAGAAGSFGVFTRIGYKLHPWADPRRWSTKVCTRRSASGLAAGCGSTRPLGTTGRIAATPCTSS